MEKYFDWDKAKNELLRMEREVSFEEVVDAMQEGGLLDIIEHPNKEKYTKQKILIVNINDYAYRIPYVEDDVKIFLKTIFASRKDTKKNISLKNKHMKYYELDAYEKEISKAIDAGKFKSIKNLEAEKKRFQEIARATLNKNKTINIRLQSRDLQKLKASAMRQGLPYQTLISSVLHQYVEKK